MKVLEKEYNFSMINKRNLGCFVKKRGQRPADVWIRRHVASVWRLDHHVVGASRK